MDNKVSVWSLEIEQAGAWVATQIEPGDILYVRPGLRRFAICRPRVGSWEILGHKIPMLVGGTVKLRLVDGLGGVFERPTIPSGSDDEITRIRRYYGAQLFSREGTDWLEERDFASIDQRFRYVAIKKSKS